MATRTSTSVSCGECGQPLDPTVAQDSDRDPCPQCGSTGIAIAIGIAEEINIACGIDVGAGPGDYERDAVRRWTEADAEVHALEQPLPGNDRDTILDAQRRLYAVFIDLWSMRETLIDEHGIAPRDVDDVIDKSPKAVALAHDLGNVAKHGSPLTRRPRSGRQPTFHQPQAMRLGSGGQWRFRLNVGYDGTSVNAVDIAREAVEKWRETLTDWGLL